MKKFAPHIVFFSLLAISAIVGVTANIPIVAGLLGALAGVVTDPLLVVGAILIGASTRSPTLLLIIAIPFAVLFSVLIASSNAYLGVTLNPFFVVVRMVAVVGIAYISNGIRIIVQPPRIDRDSKKYTIARVIARVRRHFNAEVYWRLFLVLQSICLFIIIYVDTTASSWDAVPKFLDYSNRYRAEWGFLNSEFMFEWDFLKGSYWVRQQQNWVLLICSIGPYIITKAISWVGSGNASDSETQEDG